MGEPYARAKSDPKIVNSKNKSHQQMSQTIFRKSYQEGPHGGDHTPDQEVTPK